MHMSVSINRNKKNNDNVNSNNRLINEMKVMDKKQLNGFKELYEIIEQVRINLDSFYKNINLAENDLIDYYIYRIKAEEAKYDYLIRIAKKLEERAM